MAHKKFETVQLDHVGDGKAFHWQGRKWRRETSEIYPPTRVLTCRHPFIAVHVSHHTPGFVHWLHGETPVERRVR